LSLELLERRVLVVRVCADAFKRLDFGVCVFGRSEFKAGRRRHDVPGAIIGQPCPTCSLGSTCLITLIAMRSRGNPLAVVAKALLHRARSDLKRHATSGILLDQMSQERSSVV
ncbi:hypothetical protein KCU94_g244, partial [Aureobasidium melanogenum]